MMDGHESHHQMDHSNHMDHGQMGIDPMAHNHMPSDHMGHMDHMTQMGRMDHKTSEAHNMMMSMVFHGGYMETILFSWWDVKEVGQFVGSFIAIFIIAILYEGLKYYRKHLLWKTYTGLQYCAVAPPDKGVANICTPDDPQVIQPMPHVVERNIPTMLSAAHGWQTFLHGVQVLVSYMLMLIFMTFNTWLCAAVVLGSATGYFLFGWRESVIVDFTEHCH